MMNSNGNSKTNKKSDSEARREILANLHKATSPEKRSIADRPAWRTPPRISATPEDELAKLLAEINGLGGTTRQLSSKSDIQSALSELVSRQHIQRATCWETSLMEDLQIVKILKEFGVEIIPPHSGKFLLAECDLGITTANCALPETGTLFLCSTKEQPFIVSLLPRVHLVILDPGVLRVDIAQAFKEFQGKRFISITGPSRTADIELTLSIGVHGPKALEVWALPDAQR